ncbi:MAG: hypothetical protein HYS65_04750, partial [Betaproteobacteria bacterium]|nr:hypothetical protein [Betaproteobacteria bacterium]
QMMIADRALDPPGDFGSEHTDAMSCRDQGWLMGWAENPQEAFDNCLINYRVGEYHRVLLPQFVCQDGPGGGHLLVSDSPLYGDHDGAGQDGGQR